LKEYRDTGTYDALLCFSGGKDSTYTLWLLRKKLGLRVLAVTFDNGFLPEQTSKNIFSPNTLMRASSICTACISIVKFGALRIALEKNIQFIMFGWSSGQSPITSAIMKNNPQIIKMIQNALYKPLHELMGDDINPCFLEKKHIEKGYNFPYNISPLAFFGYDEDDILRKITKMGWKLPIDIDSNTTNCLLNSFANIVHKKKYGYHPYALEMTKLVREGYMERYAALEKLMEPENKKTVAAVKKKLGL